MSAREIGCSQTDRAGVCGSGVEWKAPQGEAASGLVSGHDGHRDDHLNATGNRFYNILFIINKY